MKVYLHLLLVATHLKTVFQRISLLASVQTSSGGGVCACCVDVEAKILHKYWRGREDIICYDKRGSHTISVTVYIHCKVMDGSNKSFQG